MKNIKILHYGIHNNLGGNLGDKIHFYLLRQWFEQFLYPTKITWKLKQIWENNSEKDVQYINKKINLILIGGGGLFLSDQKYSNTSNSGWQLNISDKLLFKINKPIVVFGVGYNRFRNQKDFKPIFTKNVNILNEKTFFFGLRNKGSIKKLSNYLSTSKKLQLQPCITTIINKLNYFKNLKFSKKQKKKIAIGLSADRINYRFKNEKSLKNFTSAIESLILIWKKKDYDVDIILHKNLDLILAKKIKNEVLKKVSIINLTNVSVKKAIKYYKSINLLFAMRGHHQLISAGLCTPFYSIISHDKIKFFVDDNKLNQFSADVNDKNFKKKLLKFSNSKSNIMKIKKKLNKVIKNNFKITKKNSLIIKKKLQKFT